MNAALQDIGSAAAERDNAYRQRKQEQWKIAALHTERHWSPGHQPDCQDGWNGQPDGCEHGTEQNVYRTLELIAQGRTDCA